MHLAVHTPDRRLLPVLPRRMWQFEGIRASCRAIFVKWKTLWLGRDSKPLKAYLVQVAILVSLSDKYT